MTSVLAVAVPPPGAHAKPATRSVPLDASAPGRTDRGSVPVSGRTVAGATVQVTGGAVPVTGFARGDGGFAVEVPLRPGRPNKLTATASAGTVQASKQLPVVQSLKDASGTASGRVLDVLSRAPLAGARVSYGDRYAVTGPDGGYTLHGLPEGTLAITARAAGHLGGVTFGVGSGATGTVPDLLLQQTAAPVRVGPAGGTFTGPGWRIQVPAGAAYKATDLVLTTLESAGPLDSWGAAVVAVQATPPFSKPVRVALDPAAFGLDPMASRVVAVGGDGTTGSTVLARTVNRELVFDLTRLSGLQYRLQAVPGTTQRTAWETVLSRIGADGRVDLATALQAFALAVTPLPGVKVPPGPIGDIGSGSGPVRWLLGHRNALTTRQSHVLTAWLGDLRPAEPAPAAAVPAVAAAADGGTAAAFRTAAPIRTAAQALAAPAPSCAQLPTPDDLVPLQACVELAKGLIADRFGIPLTLVPLVHFDSRRGSDVYARALPRDATGNHAQGTAFDCVISVTPRFFGLTQQQFLEVVAHEVFHCYQAQLLVDLAAYVDTLRAAPWIIEGQAEFVGLEIAKVIDTPKPFWSMYLTRPQVALFARSYDAVGFYGHLQYQRIDPWAAFARMLGAVGNSQDSPAAFQAAISAAPDRLLDTWPSGYARFQRERTEWETGGPAISDDAPQVSTTPVPNGGGVTIAALRVANDLRRLNLTGDVTRFTVNGEAHGRLGPSSGNDLLLRDITGEWCTRPEGCRCPDGSAGPDSDLPVLPSGLTWLAATGGSGTGTVEVSAREVAECEPDDDDLPPGGEPGGGPEDGATTPDPGTPDPGSGGSYGDPHFITFDSGSLSFQGAGDYVLAESTTDDFLVQGRYQRLRLSGGTVTGASYNRGVAARVGDAVIAFGDDATADRRDPQVASLNGQPLALVDGARTTLPGGAVLTFSSGGGAVVRWPDGTELAAGRFVGDNAFVTLAPARWGRVRGLLGNADRDPRNDLSARDGTVVRDPADPAQLYGVFGASWRVTGAASLFRSVLPPDGALPVDPPGAVSVAGLPADVRAAAERQCRDRGLAPGAGLEQCIFDLGVSGDPTFADGSVVVANRLRRSVDVVALDGPVEDTAEIGPGRRVSGSLTAPFRADVYLVDLQAGDGIRIATPGGCPGLGTFVIALVAPSGRPVGRSRGPGCGALGTTALREAGRYQVRVLDTGGFTGDYEFQVDAAATELSCQATQVAPNDDDSGPEVPLPFPVDFHGRRFSSLWVNNNGNITFDGPLQAFTPAPIQTVRNPMVAAWWGDVDTRGANSQRVRFGFGTVDGRRAFCVDYDRVGYFALHDDRLNSFQLFVVDRGDVADGAFDIVYRYRQMQWETGDASDGQNGLGGTSAGVGYTNGTGLPGTFVELAGSRQPGTFLDDGSNPLSRTSSNSSEVGVHRFAIRTG
ncbi:MAG TPA: nidogen-like domain-containing protein [Micromonosporaceae bacterium]|nr:nidogen-like domain-containing protein [Micromonosporaceae bacterium]